MSGLRRYPTTTLLTVALLSGAAAAEDFEASAFVSTPTRPLAGRDLVVTVRVPRDPANVDTDMRAVELDLRKPSDLAALETHVATLARLADAQDDHEEKHPERVLPFRHDLASKGKRVALREIGALAEQLRRGDARLEQDEATRLHLLELLHAVQNNFRYPVKRHYQLIPEIVPVMLIRMRSHRAVSAAASPSPESDPAASSFWSPPGDIAAKDLYAGFGRRSVPSREAECEYRAPKTGWGAHSGFHVRCGDVELRFKSGNEIYGGPFNTRIFDALGYSTYPIDTVPRLTLRYDRRVLAQFHSRKRLAVSARLLFVDLFTHVITDEDDPFDLVDHAVMKNGRTLSGPDLRRALLKDGRVVKGRPRPETMDANYDTDFESQIAELVWKPGTVALEPEDVKQVGPWDYDQLDRDGRREVRAVFVLAAWLDQFNMRWENTRLAYFEGAGGGALRHVFSDVGSGLGLARDLRHCRNSDVEAMPWEITTREGQGVRFSGFAPNVSNRAFDAMDWHDARWMLRKIAAVSEQQILGALLATHMSAAEVRLALEKLLSKRRKMIEDFDLTREFPEIAARPIDRRLDFDPRDPVQLRQVTLALPEGGEVVPRVGEASVAGGHLVQDDRRP